MAEQIWGAQMVRKAPLTQRATMAFYRALHRVGHRHLYLWTYRAGVDSGTYVLLKQEECAFCPVKRGPIVIEETGA